MYLTNQVAEIKNLGIKCLRSSDSDIAELESKRNLVFSEVFENGRQDYDQLDDVS